MTDTQPVDEAAVEAVEKIFEADWTILNVPNAKDVFARIITDAYADQTTSEFDAFDRKHYPSFDAPVAEAVERLFRHWSNTPDHTLFGIDKTTQIIKDAFQEYDLRHKYYGSCVGQTPEILMAISHRRRLTVEREVREKLVDAVKELRAWGIEFDDERLKYMSVQVDRFDIEEVDAALAEADKLEN